MREPDRKVLRKIWETDRNGTQYVGNKSPPMLPKLWVTQIAMLNKIWETSILRTIWEINRYVTRDLGSKKSLCLTRCGKQNRYATQDVGNKSLCYTRSGKRFAKLHKMWVTNR